MNKNCLTIDGNPHVGDVLFIVKDVHGLSMYGKVVEVYPTWFRLGTVFGMSGTVFSSVNFELSSTDFIKMKLNE